MSPAAPIAAASVSVDQLVALVAKALGKAAVEPELLSIGQVSAFVNLSARTIWRMVSAGEFPKPVRIGAAPGRRIGRATITRWKRSAVVEWVESLN